MNRVKELREAMGWNQTELGKKLNVKAAAISKYEKGDVSLTDETLKSLASIFEVSTDYILCLTNDPIPVRNLDQDIHDEHDYTKELEALLDDEPLRTEFQDYDDWTEEEKRNLLNFIKGQKALKKINEEK